ncbi:acyl-CoA reductase [Actinokineospora sp. G85]|uniref:acyl-CoA reductase n=1 Tax=Actinokineospora sp. G85 TaxID=3406626 RepID=UPI003C71A16B
MTLTVPAVVRGELVEGPLVGFGGRGETGFAVADPAAVVPRLGTRNLALSRELAALDLDEVLDYLAELGARLVDNKHLDEAVERSAGLADTPPGLVHSNYRLLPGLFAREATEEVVAAIGRDVLTGWPERRMADGRVGAVHAFGVRSVHVIAGNSPLIAAMTLVRTAVTRGEAVVKTPSNDPLTMVALARTMIDMAPGHPLTRAVSVAYWKGGDEALERRLYHPAAFDKIVAWGGMASVKHVVRYLEPGLELVAFDPKRSATILGPEAFEPAALDDVARRLALDVGAFNQVGCVNARVVYAVCDTAAAEDLARRVYAELQELPPTVSTAAGRVDTELRADLRALRAGGFHTVVGGEADEGAVIVSHLDEPVGFAGSLAGRVANIVPVETAEDAARHLDATTQTVGVYPAALRHRLREVLPLVGVQRTVELGCAVSVHPALPQDGFEPARRLVRWVTDEHLPAGSDPLDIVFPPHREENP